MNRPGSAPGGGAAATGGSAVIPPELTSLLVRGGCRRFELLLDARHVLRVLEELLEQAPHALARGRAEGRRLVVGQVEDDRLRVQQGHLGRAGDRIRVDTRRNV